MFLIKMQLSHIQNKWMWLFGIISLKSKQIWISIWGQEPLSIEKARMSLSDHHFKTGSSCTQLYEYRSLSPFKVCWCNIVFTDIFCQFFLCATCISEYKIHQFLWIHFLTQTGTTKSHKCIVHGIQGTVAHQKSIINQSYKKKLSCFTETTLHPKPFRHSL